MFATVLASQRRASEVVVRTVTTDDLEDILRAAKDLTSCIGARGRSRWTELLTRADARVLLAEQAGQIVGIGSVRGSAIGELEILAPESTGAVWRTIGAACMEAARDLGASVLLGKVCPPSEHVAALYEDLGFTLVQVLRAHDELESGSWAEAHVFALALDTAGS